MTPLALPLRQPRVMRLPLAMTSDEGLAEMAAAGDRGAFTVLYERYRAPLSRYCRSIVRDQDEAGDAFQNTMVAVLRALENDAPSGRVKPWLYRIAHNESIDLIRRRRDTQPVAEVPEPRAGIAASQREVGDQLEGLLADLRALPERQRGALLMRELVGLEYDEIARVFATSAVGARKLVYEARVSLQAMNEGRELGCDEIRRRLSDGDGRTSRSKAVRAHLEGCSSCRAFEASIQHRRSQFALLPALPAVGVGSLLTGSLTGVGAGKALVGGASATAGAATIGTAGTLSGVGGALAVKCLTVCGVLAAAGAGAALVGHTATPVHHHRAAPLHASVNRPARASTVRITATATIRRTASAVSVGLPAAPVSTTGPRLPASSAPPRQQRVSVTNSQAAPSATTVAAQPAATPPVATQPSTPAASTSSNTPAAAPTAPTTPTTAAPTNPGYPTYNTGVKPEITGPTAYAQAIAQVAAAATSAISAAAGAGSSTLSSIAGALAGASGSSNPVAGWAALARSLMSGATGIQKSGN